MNIPDTIGCAQCGKPLSWHDSYGLSVPLEERKVKASDFCDLACLTAWCADMARAAGRKPN